MPDNVAIDLSGDKELIAALNNLTPALEKKALRTALRESSKPILSAAKARAPRDTGALKKSLRIKAFKRTRKGKVGFSIGTSSLGSAYQGKQFYGAFQEYGWHTGKRTNEIRRSQSAARRGSTTAKQALLGDSRKFIEGRKYMRQAYTSQKQATLTLMRQRIFEAIDRTVKAQAAKGIKRK